MTPDLKDAFSIENLRLSWRRINTNPNLYYKGYFENIYQSYGIALDINLEDLHRRLKRNEFVPQHATKIYLPKKSGILRTYSLLTVEDQIVYQAMVNVVAEKLDVRVKRRYLKDIFGNIYAGKKSVYFYKDWRKCYPRFGQAIRDVYAKGFKFTASFDLTACYDTIDHKVLSHSLVELGISIEFTQQLCKYLSHWTATFAEVRIYQGHGIPQGPLSSGLLSEVVLRHFDEKRTVNTKLFHYFRYVDDMRFFAKNEHDLRAMLVEMDLLSKQIGLFPQSSKIEIHEVTDILIEIKTISQPSEHIGTKTSPNQKKIQKRLKELTLRHKIQDETRFKYVLGASVPQAGISSRLIKILKTNPHLYITIFKYFSKYKKIPDNFAIELIQIIEQNSVYAAFAAEGLRSLIGRCSIASTLPLIRISEKFIKSSQPNGELIAASYAILIRENKMSYSQILTVLTESHEWWTRSELLVHIDFNYLGEPSYKSVMNHFLKDLSVDVSVVAAILILEHSLDVNVEIGSINHVAQNILKASGFINYKAGGSCPISEMMQDLLGTPVKDIKWKKLLGGYYIPIRKKIARLKSYKQDNPGAWVGLIDTIHANLLECLFTHDNSIGNYSGDIGVHLAKPNTKFFTKYPLVYRGFKYLHDKRYQSELTHSNIRRTGRSTGYIPYKFIQDVKPSLRRAYLELWSKY